MISAYFVITFIHIILYVKSMTDPSNCKANQYYDINTYVCKECPVNQVVAKDSKLILYLTI